MTEEEREALLAVVDAALVIIESNRALVRQLLALFNVLRQKGVVSKPEIREALTDFDRELALEDDPGVNRSVTSWNEMEERLKEARRRLAAGE